MSKREIPPHLIRFFKPQSIIKPKDDIGVPWAVATALRADGWYLRSPIVWSKPNPMPESCRDRPTSAHEHIFLLTKSARYWYDADAVRVPALHEEHMRRYSERSSSYQKKVHDTESFKGMTGVRNDTNGRAIFQSPEGGANLRNVWTIPTQGFAGAHFATFPQELVRTCLKAGTSEKGCCSMCGAPWSRMVEREVTYGSGSGKTGNVPNGKHAGSQQAVSGSYDIRMGPQVNAITTGWQAGCACTADVMPCTVLDPFGGSGTTGLVADQLNRNAILIELNEGYALMSQERIQGSSPMFAQVTIENSTQPDTPGSPLALLSSDNSDTALSGSLDHGFLKTGTE